MENGELHERCRILAGQVLAKAKEKKLKIGCAESCTGGLVASYLTAIPGSSDSFVGGIVSYWEDVKEAVLGVDERIIDEYGVVSEECAAAMAACACKLLGCDCAVATTGIAGPTGAEQGKPVGTICYGLSCASRSRSLTHCEGSSRDEVRMIGTRIALEELLGFIG